MEKKLKRKLRFLARPKYVKIKLICVEVKDMKSSAQFIKASEVKVTIQISHLFTKATI